MLRYFILIMVSCWRVQSGTDVCSTSSCKAMQLVVISRRNSTGHWTAQVQFDHEGGKADPWEEKESGPFVMTLEHSTSECDGKEKVHIAYDVTAPPCVASPGYTHFPRSGYYKFHSGPKVWEEARKTCIREGAHLAIINSEEESKLLQNMFAAYPKINNVKYNDFAFIGFHDCDTEGDYKTVFNRPLAETGFTRWWAWGQPDNNGGDPGEDCGSVHRNGGLNDLECDSPHAFICEQETWHK